MNLWPTSYKNCYHLYLHRLAEYGKGTYNYRNSTQINCHINTSSWCILRQVGCGMIIQITVEIAGNAKIRCTVRTWLICTLLFFSVSCLIACLYPFQSGSAPFSFNIPCYHTHIYTQIINRYIIVLNLHIDLHHGLYCGVLLAFILLPGWFYGLGGISEH